MTATRLDPRDFIYVDSAIGGVDHRNRIVEAGTTTPNGVPGCYESWGRARYELKLWVQEHRNKNGDPTVAGFDGPTCSPTLNLDFDNEGSPGVALDWLRRVLNRLDGWGVDLRALSIAFSGKKGFALGIPAALFGNFEPSTSFHRHAKRAAQLILEDIPFDSSVYDKLRLWRVLNSQHEKSHLFKIPLTAHEALILSIDEIQALAAQPRLLDSDPDLTPLPEDELEPVPELVAIWQEAIATAEASPTYEAHAVQDDERDHQTVAAIVAAWPQPDQGLSRHTDLLMPVAGFLTGHATAEHVITLLEEAARQAEGEAFLKARPGEITRLVDDSIKRRGTNSAFVGLPKLSSEFPALAKVLDALWPEETLHAAGGDQDSASADSATQPGTEWPDPDPVLDEHPAPTLPLELFPKEIADVAEDAADRIRCPLDYTVWATLSAVAGLIGRGVGFRPRLYDDWTERLALWIVLIGPPSWMKTPALEDGTRSLRRQELLDYEVYKAEHAAWKATCKEIRRMPKGEQDDPPPEPVQRRWMTSDSTTEKLAELLMPEVSHGMTMSRDELAGVINDLNRYRAGSDRQFLLQSYSGGSYTVDRIIRGTHHVPDLLLNIVGGIQPEVAQAIFAEGPDDGLAARFTSIWPSGPPEWRRVDRYPNGAARKALDAVCDRLVEASWPMLLEVDEYRPTPFCRLVEDGRDMFAAWEARIMAELRAGQYEGRAEGRAGKYRGLAARLALTSHLVDWAAGRWPHPRTVPSDKVRDALDLMDTYILPMERRVFAQYARPKTASGGQRIAAWIMKERKEHFTVREIRRHHWSDLTGEADVLAAIDWLETANWVRPVERDPNRTGRPAIAFSVNPKVWG